MLSWVKSIAQSFLSEESALATIKDVALQAGVSVSTVSHVINKTRFVSEALSERVMVTMRELNYQPNEVARSLRTKRTHIVALVIPDITNPYFPEIARGVQDVAEENKCVVIVCNTDRDLKRERSFLNTLRQQRVDGIILNPSKVTLSDLQEVTRSQIPVVLIGSQIDHPDYDVVMVDNVQGGRDAVKYLHDLGHQRIGFIGGPRTSSSGDQRYQGYLRALTECSLPLIQPLICEGPFTHEGGYQCMKHMLNLGPHPTAVFAASDIMAIGVLMAIQDSGLQVPKDISLVGFDDIDEVSITTPKLTTIAQPQYQTGEVAGHLLFNHVDGNSPHQRRRVVLDHKLVVRESAGPPG